VQTNMAGLLIERDIHPGIAAHGGAVRGGYNRFRTLLHQPPGRLTGNNDRDFPFGKGLLRA
jgi:hypothetical protein